MYQLLEKRKWATSLCNCDPESCILAHVLPCHIYAKIYDNPHRNSCYFFNFMYYGIFCLSLYNVYYWLDYINKNRCPDLETGYCFGLGDNCSQYYMLVNGIPSKCIYNDSICVHSESDCFINYNKLNIFLSLLGSISYFVLLMLHFFLREKVKKEYNLEGNYDACAVTILSQCGLAQNYRELEVTYNV
jgi:Cys-rich protein (TIGR01571 family)